MKYLSYEKNLSKLKAVCFQSRRERRWSNDFYDALGSVLNKISMKQKGRLLPLEISTNSKNFSLSKYR